jgi:hypothetical protein
VNPHPLRHLCTCLVVATACAGGGAEPAAPRTDTSPYVDEQRSPVRGLSASEVDDLLNGRGMGLARAAELSGYPGPRHALDLRSELALDASLVAETEAIFTRMQTAAKQLGAEIVQLESELGQAFIERRIDTEAVEEQTRAIAELQGKLRATHLRAHVELTALLRPEQIAKYNELRGYDHDLGAPQAKPSGHGAHHPQPAQ